MPTDFIERARALDAAATAGPWGVEGSLFGPEDVRIGQALGLSWRRNLEWIAAARSMLPAAVEALVRVRELHRPVHPVFNWQTGLRYEDPCETCWGKAGVHECGCWSDEDTEYECRGCAAPRAGRRHTPVLWPCNTYKATEVEA